MKQLRAQYFLVNIDFSSKIFKPLVCLKYAMVPLLNSRYLKVLLPKGMKVVVEAILSPCCC